MSLSLLSGATSGRTPPGVAYTELHGLGPLDEGRLLRISGLAAGHEEAPGGRSAPSSSGAVSVLEDLGKRWYGLASDTVRGALTGTMRVVTELAQHFRLARRTLNFLTDRHLFAHRTDWFGQPTL